MDSAPSSGLSTAVCTFEWGKRGYFPTKFPLGFYAAEICTFDGGIDSSLFSQISSHFHEFDLGRKLKILRRSAGGHMWPSQSTTS